MPLNRFKATIDIIGVNPFVLLPAGVLAALFAQANKNKGPIPVRGKIDGHDFVQTLVKYSGEWRLYINTPMLKVSGTKVGDVIKIEIAFDPIERVVLIHPKLQRALAGNKEAKKVFDALRPSRRKEIIRYISFLKTEITVDRNVERAIQFLLGKTRFIGQDHP